MTEGARLMDMEMSDARHVVDIMWSYLSCIELFVHIRAIETRLCVSSMFSERFA